MKAFFYTFSLLLLCGCTGYSITGGPGKTVAPRMVSSLQKESDLIHVNSILVSPVVFDESARNAIINANKITEALEDSLKEGISVGFVPSADVLRAYGRKPGGLVPATVSTEEAIKLAWQKGCDSILVTHILEWTDRIGSAVGASRAASLSFSMDLIRVKDSKVIWTSSYSFQDQALTDNLFRIGDTAENGAGLKWETTSDLLSQGFKSAIRDLSEKRLGQFVTGDKR